VPRRPAGVPGLALARSLWRAATLVERLAAFFAALPAELGKHRPIYALEVRNSNC